MKTKNILLSFLIAFLFIGTAIAQGDLITTEQFKDLQKNTENLTIIDASKAKLYKKSHINGAINIPYKKLNQKKGAVKGLLLSTEELASFLGSKGVSDQDMIVVYDEGSQKYSSRVYWVLKKLGAPNVKLLHKDNDSWRKNRIKLTSTVPSVKAKTFTPNVNADICISTDAIDVETMVLLDARSADEFNGVVVNEKSYSKGHLPNAIHLEFKDVLNKNKSFKTAEQLTAMLEEKGLTADKTYVMYCKAGIKAAVLYVAFTQIVDFPNVKLYDGAYLEWEALSKPIDK